MKQYLKTLLFLISAILHFNRNSKILYLHDIHVGKGYAFSDCSMQINLFLRIISLIRKCGFEIVEEITRPKRQIQICFDDGYRGIWDAKEFLAQEKIYPTVFLAPNLLDTTNYLTRSEVLSLAKMGVRFQSHTMNHLSLTDLNDEELCYELAESKRQLSLLLETEITGICLPRGYFNQQVVDTSSKIYTTIYSSIPGSFHDRSHSGMICRNIIQDQTITQTILTLFGGQQLLRQRIIRQHLRL